MKELQSRKLPKSFQALLPSSNIENLDKERDKNYIIESFLGNATFDAWLWMLKNYDKNDIESVVKQSRTLKARDVNIWKLFFNIPKEEIKCLQKNFQNTQNTHWEY